MTKLSAIPAIAAGAFACYASLIIALYGMHSLQVASLILRGPFK